MKLKRRHIKELVLEELDRLEARLLKEQEEEEEGGDIFGGEEEGGEEEGGEEAEEEGGEEEAGEEEGGDEGADAEEEAEPVELNLEPGEEAEFTKTIDDELSAILLDFESDAIKSAQIQGNPLDPASIEIEGDVQETWYRQPLSKVLYEAESPPLDVDKFTSDVARLVMNYDSLIDMETFIINKAKLFILSKYDEETAEKFEQILDQTHGIAVGEVAEEEVEPEAPVAVGSGFASAPGGA